MELAGESASLSVGLDIDLQSKLDFSKLDHEKVKMLMKLEVLLLDEVSM